MPITTTELADDVMTGIGDRYLLLIRENYLDDPAGDELKTLLLNAYAIARGARDENRLERLMSSSDWREAVVGLHLAMLGRKYDADHLCDPFLQTHAVNQHFTTSLIARPALLLFTFLKRMDLIEPIFAPQVLDEDAFDVYAAAIEADDLLITGAKRGVGLLQRLEKESWFDSEAFTASRTRFRAAYQFWKAPLTPKL